MLKHLLTLTCLVCLLSSCHSGGNPANDRDSVVKIDITAAIPEKRDKVNPAPAAGFTEAVPDELNNNWHFTVQLFETPQTFTYRLAVQYKELHAADTLTVPSFGTWPKVELHKGDTPFTCIIGFLDKSNTFREYKQVSAKDDKVKISTLHHYAVGSYRVNP